MSRRLGQVVLSIALGAITGGSMCGPHPPPGCPSPDGTDAGAATRTYALVLSTPGALPLVPWRDGDTVPLEHGFQGGYMIHPTLDIDTVDALRLDADNQACFHLHVANTVADGTPLTQYDAYLQGTALTTAHVLRVELFDLLSFNPGDFADKAVTMHVQVQGPNGNGDATLTVTPHAP